MIETNILDWIDLGDKIETLEIYKNNKSVFMFRFFSTLRKFNNFGIAFHLLLKIIFFLQILCLDSIFIPTANLDIISKILTIIRPYTVFSEAIDTKSSYMTGFILSCTMTFIIIILSGVIVYQLRKFKLSVEFPFVICNIVNTVLKEILIGPIIWTMVLIFQCENGSHLYLETTCYSSSMHIVFLSVSLINLILILAILYFISIFSNDCGSIKDIRILSSLNSQYELVSALGKVTIFIFACVVQIITYSSSSTNLLPVLFSLYVFLVSAGISYYAYKRVLFYNDVLNKTVIYGWCLVAWLSLLHFFKLALNINDIVIIFVIGFVLIILMIEYFEMKRVEFLIMASDSDVTLTKSLKEVELYKVEMLNLLNLRTVKEKTVLLGVTKIFKETLNRNEEVEEKVKHLLKNEHLQMKYNNGKALEILAQIFITYHNHLEKTIIKNDILINLCYFLINNMKNFTYVSYLISKSKANTLKEKYQKFILVEEIKEHMLLKLKNSAKNSKSDYIKNVEISSVILLEAYSDVLKTKINESIYQRSDYFELMTSRIGVGNSPTALGDFLSLGDKILMRGKEIQKISNLIRDLNPFDEEIFHHYNYYLMVINKDYNLALEEKKKLNELRMSKMSDKGNIYFSLFENNSNIILVDGFNNNGSIIYANKNYYANFSSNMNDLFSKTIHDLVPSAIKDIHEEIVENGIKYSNLSYVFNKQRMLLLKSSIGLLHDVKVYIKSVPNLKHGLIYIVSIVKITEQSGIIVLDSNLVVDGLTDFFSNETIQFYLSKRKRDDVNNERHIAVMIPEIMNHIKFNPQTGKFYLQNNSSEFKGTICTFDRNHSVISMFNELLENIKSNSLIIPQVSKNSQLVQNLEQSQTSSKQMQELINTYISCVKDYSKRNFKIFYKINTKHFIGNKYVYHKIFLHKDLSGGGDEYVPNEKFKTNPTNSTAYNYTANNKDNLVIDTRGEIKLNLGNRRNVSMEQIDLDNLIGENSKGNLNEDQNFKNQVGNNLGKRTHGISMSCSTRLSTASSELSTLSTLKTSLSNNEVSIFRQMKIFAYFFLVGTLFFLFYFHQVNSYNKYNLLYSNLVQSKFFNNSKLIISQIYYNTLNVKMFKNNLYSDANCYNNDCVQFYINNLDNSISLLNELNTNSTFFHAQFKDILFTTSTLNLEIFDSNNNSKNQIETFTLNYKYMIDMIISYSLNLKNILLESSISSSTENLNMTIENILNQSYVYLTNNIIFINSDIIGNLSILASYTQAALIIIILQICFVVFILTVFFFLSFAIYTIEKTHLSNLITFKNPKFLEYTKFLTEEWKKISQNYELEMQKKEEEEVESNGLNSLNGKDNKKSKNDKMLHTKYESMIGKQQTERNVKETTKKTDPKKETQKKIIAAKQKKKIDEVQLKVSAIKNYLVNFHSFLFIKIIVIILISSSYLAVISVLDKQEISQMQQLDLNLDQLYDVFLDSNSIYFQTKANIASVFEKNILIQNTAYNLNGPILFEGLVYNSANDLQNSLSGNLTFPAYQNNNIGTLFNYLILNDQSLGLSNLYFGDSCVVLYNSTDTMLLNFCETFWSGVLSRGLEQSLTKLNSMYNIIAEDFINVNSNANNFTDLFQPGSDLQSYSQFMEIFFFDAFVLTNQLYSAIEAAIPSTIDAMYIKIIILYAIGLLLLSILLIYIIIKAKTFFNSLMNYVYIIPSEYLVEDANLYSEIMRLEKNF